MADRLRPSQVFARRVREVRERQRWSQEDLARRLGELGLSMDRAQVARIERRDRKVSIDEAFVLAHALSVSPEYMLIPLTSAEPEVLITPELAVTPRQARQWLRGRGALAGEDAKTYATEISDEEWAAQQQQGVAHVLRLAQEFVEAVVGEDRPLAAEVGDRLKAELERQAELHDLPRRMSTPDEIREFFKRAGLPIIYSPGTDDQGQPD